MAEVFAALSAVGSLLRSGRVALLGLVLLGGVLLLAPADWLARLGIAGRPAWAGWGLAAGLCGLGADAALAATRRVWDAFGRYQERAEGDDLIEKAIGRLGPEEQAAFRRLVLAQDRPEEFEDADPAVAALVHRQLAVCVGAGARWYGADRSSQYVIPGEVRDYLDRKYGPGQWPDRRG